MMVYEFLLKLLMKNYEFIMKIYEFIMKIYEFIMKIYEFIMKIYEFPRMIMNLWRKFINFNEKLWWGSKFFCFFFAYLIMSIIFMPSNMKNH